MAAIGHGGMGAVYRAERVDGEFDQEVALKLLHRDMDTPELRARFLAERQLLAGLSHPNIARLLDGGVTDEGRPYFVMELVEGRPITQYCAENGLSTDEVLRLFLDVVDAVSYLHRNLVVHRDLKPSNIFVDGDGEVKLLDFGIAKLLGGRRRTPARSTRTGQQLMTPEYAAPEQLLGEPVTTATDVYALGVLLYELLTGTAAARRSRVPTAERRRGSCRRPRVRCYVRGDHQRRPRRTNRAGEPTPQPPDRPRSRRRLSQGAATGPGSTLPVRRAARSGHRAPPRGSAGARAHGHAQLSGGTLRSTPPRRECSSRRRRWSP